MTEQKNIIKIDKILEYLPHRYPFLLIDKVEIVESYKKAIGYKNNYLLLIVFQQAFILAVIAYLPGFIISVLLYDFAMDATKLPIIMSYQNAILVLISSILMCMTSGAFAINKLRSTDPADIF